MIRALGAQHAASDLERVFEAQRARSIVDDVDEILRVSIRPDTVIARREQQACVCEHVVKQAPAL